jgi:hypothetical protein
MYISLTQVGPNCTAQHSVAPHALGHPGAGICAHKTLPVTTGREQTCGCTFQSSGTPLAHAAVDAVRQCSHAPQPQTLTVTLPRLNKTHHPAQQVQQRLHAVTAVRCAWLCFEAPHATEVHLTGDIEGGSTLSPKP